MGAFDDVPYQIAQPTPAPTAAPSAPAGAFDDVPFVPAPVSTSPRVGAINRPGQPNVPPAVPVGSTDEPSATPAQSALATFIDSAGEHLAIPGRPDLNINHLAEYLNSYIGGGSVGQQQSEEQAGAAAHPTAATAGELAGRTGAAAVASVATGGGYLGAAAGGAAFAPEHPLAGAAMGLTGETALKAGGAAIKILPPSLVSRAKDAFINEFPAAKTIIDNADKFPQAAAAVKEYAMKALQLNAGQEAYNWIQRKLSGDSEGGSGAGHVIANMADDVAGAATKVE